MKKKQRRGRGWNLWRWTLVNGLLTVPGGRWNSFLGCVDLDITNLHFTIHLEFSHFQIFSLLSGIRGILHVERRWSPHVPFQRRIRKSAGCVFQKSKHLRFIFNWDSIKLNGPTIGSGDMQIEVDGSIEDQRERCKKAQRYIGVHRRRRPWLRVADEEQPKRGEVVIAGGCCCCCCCCCWGCNRGWMKTDEPPVRWAVPPPFYKSGRCHCRSSQCLEYFGRCHFSLSQSLVASVSLILRKDDVQSCPPPRRPRLRLGPEYSRSGQPLSRLNSC